ncbi:MAG: hypothetical protein ORN28_11195, partial [Rhodoferax sp.]|nr:hypothetical protein [Rhodoferax sp.]
STADNGAEFSVVVSNSAGTAPSSHASLTVSVVAPDITSHPANQTIFANYTATFSVTTSGTAPSYQWRRNGTDTPVPFPAATPRR